MWYLLSHLRRTLGYSSFFLQTHKISNNANIGIRGFTTWKQKNASNKIYPQWVLNSWTSDSKSNILLSGLTWYLLLRLRLLAPYIVILYWFKLNHPSPKIKWYMNRSLKISQVAHDRLAQKEACWTWNQRSRGSLFTRGNILVNDIFCFT